MKHLLLGTAVLVLATAAANASTLTQTAQFGPAQADYSSTAAPLTFQFFDSNLGTLNSVSFSSTYGISSSITVSNIAQSYSSGSVRVESGAQFGSSDSAVAAVLNRQVNSASQAGVQMGSTTLSPVAYDLLTPTKTYSLAPGESTQLSGAANGSTALFTDTSATDLSAFFRPGGGTYSILLSTLTGALLSNTGGNTYVFASTTASASLNVTYNYTSAPPAVTPEPSSLLLLGTGVLGMVGAVRRRLA